MKFFTRFCYDFYQKRPYWFSFLLALSFSSLVTFLRISEIYNPSEIFEEAMDLTDVRISREKPKEDKNQEENTSQETYPQFSDKKIEAAAADLSFMPGITPPRIVKSGPKKYPPLARKKGIEAVIYLEVLLYKNGKVAGVKILYVELNKQLPALIQKKIQRSFAIASLNFLKQSVFSPPIINGENMPIKMEVPLNFKLSE